MRLTRGCALRLVSVSEAAGEFRDCRPRGVVKHVLQFVSDTWQDTQNQALLELLIALKADGTISSYVGRWGCSDEAALAIARSHLPYSALALIDSATLTAEILSELAVVRSWSEFDDFPGCERFEYVIYEDSYALTIPKVSVALHPDTPPNVIRRLAGSRNKHVRASVAVRLDLDSAVVRRLHRDKEAAVRAACARRPDCTEAVLARFAAVSDRKVRTAGYEHSHATEEIRATAVVLGVE